MIAGLGEVLIGYRIDRDVGPLVMVAAGGIFTEIYRDRSAAARAGRSCDRARDDRRGRAGSSCFTGYRGKPKGDLDALAHAIVALSQLARRPAVAEAEINPLIVRPAGEGVVAVDALVRLARSFRMLKALTAITDVPETPMSHAEAVHTLHPAAGATQAIVDFVGALRHDALSEEVRHYARRHLLDTVGVMIAGAAGDVATRAEAVLASVRPAGNMPVPGRARRADLLDAAFLGGTAAHGIELDDGYRQGSAHCGCIVIPAALSIAYDAAPAAKRCSKRIVAGYETAIALARACAPDLRQRGFHPTSAVGPFGAAMATGKLRGLTPTSSAMRSASRLRARRACSPSSTAAATSSGCMPATHRAKACRRRCLPNRASKARPT